MTRPRTLSLVALSLLAAPLAFAFRSGVSPVDRSLNIIGQLFNIQALQNQNVAVGVARFLFFILIYAILNLAGRKTVFKGDDPLSKRTSNIVAAVIAGLSAFFVPADVILTNAAGYASIVWILLAAVPGIAAMWYAFGKRENERSRFNHAIDLLVLLLGLAWSWFMLETLIKWLVTSFPNTGSLVEETLSWVIVFMTIAVFVKLFQLLFGGGPGGSWEWPWKGGGSGPTTSKKSEPLSEEEKKRIEEREREDAAAGRTGLDTSRPGYVKVLATTIDGTPLQGVKVHIYPKGHKSKLFKKKDPRMMHLVGFTDADGAWPAKDRTQPMGSGVVTIEAEKLGWRNITWYLLSTPPGASIMKGTFQQVTDSIVEEGETLVIPLTFELKDQKPGFFEPIISNISRSEDKKSIMMDGTVQTPKYRSEKP